MSVYLRPTWRIIIVPTIPKPRVTYVITFIDMNILNL